MSILIIRLTIKTVFDGYNSEEGRMTMHRIMTDRSLLEVDR
jgi:hypothetical protein